MFMMIVATWIGLSTPGGAPMSFHQFASQKACELSRDDIMHFFRGWVEKGYLFVICVSREGHNEDRQEAQSGHPDLRGGWRRPDGKEADSDEKTNLPRRQEKRIMWRRAFGKRR